MKPSFDLTRTVFAIIRKDIDLGVRFSINELKCQT